jgi:putative spermidine/putrescine transport system substrate-binding protein
MLINSEKDQLRIRCSRRELLGYGLMAFGASLLGRASDAGVAAAAAAGQDLNVLFTGGTWKQYFEQVYSAPFAKEKGVNVVYSLGDFNRQLSRVIAERQNQRSDLLHMHQYNAAELAELNLIVPPDPKIVTNLKDVDPAFRFPHFVGKVLAPFGIAYNTKRISRKVTSWKDLWDPAFKGKVAFPKWEWIGATWFYGANRVWGGDEANVDAGMKACRELIQKQNAIIMNNVDHGLTLFTSEEIWVAPFYSARAQQAKEAGAPIEFVFPDEGGLNWVFNVGIIKGRPAASETLAQEFVNYTLDPARQAEFAGKIGYPPTNRRAMALLPKGSKAVLGPAQLANLGKLRFDVKQMVVNRDKHAERWNKEVLGG